MVKEHQHFTTWAGIVIMFVIMFVVLMFMADFQERITNLENQIKELPKRVCHQEESFEWKNFSLSDIRCLESEYCIPSRVGISLSADFNLVYCDKESLECLFKYATEVCEIK